MTRADLRCRRTRARARRRPGRAAGLRPPLQAQAAAEPPARTRAANAPAGHSPALRSRAPVTVNFVNADVEAVTRAMAAMIERQIALDPRVKGTITLYSDQPLTVREAYLNYLSALRGLGFTMVENGGLLKVVPEADAKLQTGTVSVGEPALRGDQIITQIFQLNHENPNNLVAVLRPLISANNTINANPGSNSLVITDYADNLQRIAKIIAALDQPSASDTDVVPLKHAVASDLAPMVQRLAEGGAAGAAGRCRRPAAARHGAGRSAQQLADPARRQPGAAGDRALDRRQARPADRSGGGPAGNIWVVYLKNADAVKLAAVLRAAFAAGARAAAAAAAAARPLRPTPQPVRAADARGGGARRRRTPVAASASPSTGGFIQADPATNSLIITAPEPLYRQLRNVIDQLDSRRAQVYIETLIVKVDADKAAEIGIQWQAISGDQNSSTNYVGGTNYTGADNIVNLTGGHQPGPHRAGLAGRAGGPELRHPAEGRRPVEHRRAGALPARPRPTPTSWPRRTWWRWTTRRRRSSSARTCPSSPARSPPTPRARTTRSRPSSARTWA